jgi:hypothetical protein
MLKLSLLPRAVALLLFAAAAFPSTLRAEPFPGGAKDTLGPAFKTAPDHPRPHKPSPGLDVVRRWNQIAVDASGLDHTPLAPGETGRVYGEQLGPGRAARAMAIVHIAVFEVVNATRGQRYQSYLQLRRAPVGTSLAAAVATAAHDTLVGMFPSQKSRFDAFLAEDLAKIPRFPPRGMIMGVALGRSAASAMLSMRAGDGSDYKEPLMGSEFVPSELAGWWRQDPIGHAPIALGAKWGHVTPFVMASPDQFRAPPPPALTSSEYTAAYAEVRAVGGDGITTPTVRTAEQTQIGIFWAYDGTPSLCAPPRLYNQLTNAIAENQHTTDVLERARLLALINVAMADAGIAVWESKFLYQLWRPVTGIRESDPGTGPTGTGDGNPDTIGDPTFSPLGAPASNLQGPNFTPPFPAYPSGHAGFGGALFQTLRRFYGTDAIPFTFVSDEFNGETRGNDGMIRPLVARSFQTLSQAEEENGQSRIYLGIHWSFDKTEGIAQGRKVGDYVFDHVFRPVSR